MGHKSRSYNRTVRHSPRSYTARRECAFAACRALAILAAHNIDGVEGAFYMAAHDASRFDPFRHSALPYHRGTSARSRVNARAAGSARHLSFKILPRTPAFEFFGHFVRSH